MRISEKNITRITKMLKMTRLQPVLSRLYRVVLRKKIIIVPFRQYEAGRRLDIGLGDFKFYDQSWSNVKQLDDIFSAKLLRLKFTPRQNKCKNTKITKVSNKSAKIAGGRQLDNWIYWVYEGVLPKKYLITFNATIETFLTEFQIAFKHESIAKRIRFQVVNNQYLSFDVVRNGLFVNHIYSKSLSFERSKSYRIELLVAEDIYSFMVDGKPLLTLRDRSTKNEGGLVFVFWDKYGKDEMRLNIDDFQIFAVELKGVNE